MDDGCETLVGFFGAHGDAFELLEFAEEVLDQMTPCTSPRRAAGSRRAGDAAR